MITGLLKNNFSLFPQSLHSQTEVQASPSLKHSQQFFWHLVLAQVHFLTITSESAQVEVDDPFSVFFSLSQAVQAIISVCAGQQSQLIDPFLVVWGQEPRRSSKRLELSQFSKRPSIIIIIGSQTYISTWFSSHSILILIAIMNAIVIRPRVNTKRLNGFTFSPVEEKL